MTREAEYPQQITPIQAWLLGYIDAATMLDRLAGSPDMLAEYGRALTDNDYADALLADAERANEPYAAYDAATDHADEALLLAQEAEGQQVDDEWRERARELAEARDALGLSRSDDHVNEPEVER